MLITPPLLFFFFFNDTATTEIYTLSLHDALPIWASTCASPTPTSSPSLPRAPAPDRKSTRLNSSHVEISYAVFCLKKKNRPRLRCRVDRKTRTVVIFRCDHRDHRCPLGSRRASLANQTPPRVVGFFFNDTATTEIYTLSLHDALPI